MTAQLDGDCLHGLPKFLCRRCHPRDPIAERAEMMLLHYQPTARPRLRLRPKRVRLRRRLE